MERKREWKFFTIYEHEKEQEYLRAMHRSGWKFTRISGLCVYHFEKCTPEDVIYQLDYNQEGLAHKEEYVQMFRDCGWEYLQDYIGYSYFRKPASETNGDEEIFCDEASRAQMMERVFKGRLVPMLILFCTVLLPQIILQSINGHHGIAAMYAVLIALYVWIFVHFAWKYAQYKNGK